MDFSCLHPLNPEVTSLSHHTHFHGVLEAKLRVLLMIGKAA